ncbi:MAG: signal recognition particle-docking protein FtsY [Chloroflexi bacterium]|nr:signal recognition particle-docking protein FtsY [Chloroflexota bacterium]
MTGDSFLFSRLRRIDESVRRTREAWFSKVTGLFSRSQIDEDLWDELEELLIQADVGVNTATKLVGDLRAKVKQGRLKTPADVQVALQEDMVAVLRAAATSVSTHTGVANAKPHVVLVVGVNGTGKTTSIAKLAHHYKQSGKKVLLAAADTFRAAAIDQLKIWGERIGVDVIAHQPGSDPGAVVFDAMQAAQSRSVDLLIVDTAGRLHTKFNLMEEIKKVKRVIGKADATAPHEVLLVVDATTGQNGLSQAHHFTQAVGISGTVLAKLDGTAKGGIAFAIAQELKIPITYVGTGEKLDDLAEFDPEQFVNALFSRVEGRG